MDNGSIAEAIHDARPLPSAVERRQLRESAGLVPRQLAELVGVDVSTIVRWESGGEPRRASRQRSAYVRALDELQAAIDA